MFSPASARFSSSRIIQNVIKQSSWNLVGLWIYGRNPFSFGVDPTPNCWLAAILDSCYNILHMYYMHSKQSINETVLGDCCPCWGYLLYWGPSSYNSHTLKKKSCALFHFFLQQFTKLNYLTVNLVFGQLICLSVTLELPKVISVGLCSLSRRLTKSSANADRTVRAQCQLK